jgi:hypothetical protein
MDHQAFAQLLGNYGEFVGAFAVVTTLIYLAAQLRQNTKAMQSAAELEAARHWSEQNIRAALDSDITRIMDVGHRGDVASLDDDERRKYIWFLASHFYMVDGLWKLYQKGQLSEDAWLPYERQINGSKDIPAVRAWLASGVSPLSDSFREHFGIVAPDSWSYGRDMARMFDDL